MFYNSFPACAFCFVLLVEISSCTLISLFRPGSVHIGSASWDDCDQVFPDEFHVSSFPDRLLLDSGIVSPLWLHWVKDVCVFRWNLPPARLAEWPWSFTCHCSNTDVERTLNRSQHTKLTLEKKMLVLLLPGLEVATFWSWVRRSNQQAIPALANRRMANSVDPVLGHHTSQERQPAAVPELSNDQPHQPPKQNQNITFCYILWTADPFATKLGLLAHHHKQDCLVKGLNYSVVVKMNITGKVQNSSECSSWWYLLNCLTFCNQTLFVGTSS